MEYTRSQKETLNKFEDFLRNDHQVFILKGAAGTGKTTILKQMIAMATRSFGGVNRTVLLAPTGRAAHILRKKTGYEASTIHKYIYSLQPLSSNFINSDYNKEEYSDLKLHFGLRFINEMSSRIFFVDESSLISNVFSDNEAFIFGSGYLLNDLMEFVKHNKIVFVGDPVQLPPVGMNISPALDKEYLTNNYGVACDSGVLTEVVRQVDKSGILLNASNIRKNIEAKHFSQFHVADGIDVAKSTDLVEDFVGKCKGMVSKSIVLTYRNADARDYNLRIRKKLYGEEVPRLLVGDLLVVSRNNYLRGELYNGTIVKIVGADEEGSVIRRSIQVPQKQKENGQPMKTTVELRFRPITIAYLMNGQPCNIDYLLLENYIDSPQPQIDRNTAVALYLDFKFRHSGLKEGSSQFKEELMADEYYNALCCKYGYAITCHKAQGGEWENVFVDMNRIGGIANENYFRWAYTAITRASKHLWHYNSPDFDVFSNLSIQPIIMGGRVSYPSGSNIDFKNRKFNAIKTVALMDSVRCEEDLTVSYQHRLTFSDNLGCQARFILWYNKKGYSNRPPECYRTNNDVFAAKCKLYLLAEDVPIFTFDSKGRQSAQILHNHIEELLDELGIKIINVVNNDWHDSYHLMTTGCSVVEFWYNSRGQYTYMKPMSSLGSEDKLLKLFCERF